jgi:hypothetical protein
MSQPGPPGAALPSDHGDLSEKSPIAAGACPTRNGVVGFIARVCQKIPVWGDERESVNAGA